jgi:structural maintenance of chromosome 2
VGADIDALKETITNLKATVQSAKDKQKAAQDECKKLDKDMTEFKDNKEGKIAELKVRLLPLSFSFSWGF